MKKNRFFKAVLLGMTTLLAALAVSCSDVVNEDAQNGYVELKYQWGYIADDWTTIRFELPKIGSDRIYAERTACPNDANATMYDITAFTDYEMDPFNFSVHIQATLGYYDVNKTWHQPHLQVRMTENVSTDGGKTVTSTKTFVQDIWGGSDEFSSKDYHQPMADDGIFTLNWNISDQNVRQPSNASDTTQLNYPLLKCKLACPVKTIN